MDFGASIVVLENWVAYELGYANTQSVQCVSPNSINKLTVTLPNYFRVLMTRHNSTEAAKDSTISILAI